MPHPISQPEAQTAQEQKAEDNPQLRSRAQRYFGVVPAVLEFLWFLNFRLVVVKISAHILASTPLTSEFPALRRRLFAGHQTDYRKSRWQTANNQ
jgi:hypothetical protein